MADSERKSQALSRNRLAVILRERLELAEEWFPLTSRPELYFDKVSSWTGFERKFKQVLAMGCRGDVMLTCLSRFASYSGEHVVVSPGTYDPETGELIREPQKEWKAIINPPNAEQRESIKANLNAAITIIEKYERVLFEMGTVSPPLVEEFGVLSAELSVVYLPRLLRWSCRLLSADGVGNFATVHSAGQLAPCVYMELLITQKRKLGLALKAVAGMLNAISGTNDYDQEPMREALNRFKKQYGAIYRELREKIWALHERSNTSPDDWQAFFLAETKSPRR
jgi:hypothetical protein